MGGFENAVHDINEKKPPMSDAEMLKLYGLYKQATMGSCSMSQPGGFDLKARAKWEAWNSNQGMSQGAAKSAYIAFANQMLAKL